MTNDDLSSYFPNSPRPGEIQKATPEGEVGPLEGRELIEIPSYNAYHKGPPAVEKIDQFQQRNAGRFLLDKLTDSFFSALPRSFEKTANHYLACFKGAEVMDKGTLQEIEGMVKEISNAPTIMRQRKLFHEKLHPYLLGLRLTRR